MIERDKALHLQAWLDGELPEVEACEVAAWVERDAEAQALRDVLVSAQACMADGEKPRAVPESREFYWSKIRQGIEAAEPSQPAPRDSFWSRLFVGWRILAPVGAAAALALLGGWFFWPEGESTSATHTLAVGHEVETPMAETTSFTFRSESEQMTVVWVDFEIR